MSGISRTVLKRLCVNRHRTEPALQHVGGGTQRGAAVADERRSVHGREHARLQVGEFVQARRVAGVSGT